MTLKDAIKKAIITGTIAAGAGAGAYQAAQPNCDYTVPFEGENICLTEEQKQVIESQLPVSRGFGGLKFGTE